jgi:hypothetical protein
MKLSNVPDFNRKLAAAVMPEDVVLRQQRGVKPRRRPFFGWLLTFARPRADTKPKPADETQSSSASAFRSYDWRTEHLPLIRKLEEEKKRLPAVEEESSSIEQEKQHREQAAVISPEEASTSEKEEMELSKSSQMSDDNLSSESSYDQPIVEDMPAAAKKNDAGLPHVSSACSLASLLGEDPSQRIFSPKAA